MNDGVEVSDPNLERSKRTILITGASGKVARKLRQHFAAVGYTMRLIDRRPEHGIDDHQILKADLSVYDKTWASQFIGVETVVHLAADPNAHASWESIYPNNVVATENVMRAARSAGVRRMIFASSNWVMTGYRFEQPNKLTTDLPPKPMNAYGVSKLLGERMGVTGAGEMSFIAFRIGACESNFNNLSRCDPWFQQMWLSDRDLCHAMELGVVAKNIEYEVLNLMSNNRQMRWDIEETRKKIGYDPVDCADVIETNASLLRRKEAIEHHHQWKTYSDLCARVMV